MFFHGRKLHDLCSSTGEARPRFHVGAYQAYKVTDAHGNTAGGPPRVCSRTDQPNCYTYSVTTNIQQPVTVTGLLGELPSSVLMRMSGCDREKEGILILDCAMPSEIQEPFGSFYLLT